MLEHVSRGGYTYYDAANNDLRTKNAYDAGSLIKFIGNKDGTYQIHFISPNIFIQAFTGASNKVTLGDNPATFTIQSANAEINSFLIRNSSLNLHRNLDPYLVSAAANATGDHSQWKIHEVEVEEVRIITDLSESNNTTTYTVTATPRTSWAADETGFTSIKALGLEADKNDEKQQFAFIKPEGSENYYLYAVGAQQYIALDGSLTDQISKMYPLYFADASRYMQYHVRTYFDAEHNINVAANGSFPIVIGTYANAEVGTSYLIEVADESFDPTVALEVFSNMCIVTYELYDESGTEPVSSVSIEQEKNSEVVIPESLKNEKIYTYRTDVTTVGSHPTMTVKVYRTFVDGLATSPEEIKKNEKTYRIEVPRGTFTINDGTLANTVKDQNYPITYFAILSDGQNDYLWSVDHKRFVGADGKLTVIPAPITFDTQNCDKPYIKIHYNNGSLTVNATAGHENGVTINGANPVDEGNTCMFFEQDDFNIADIADAYEALVEMLDSRFGDKLGQYSLENGDTETTLGELRGQYSAKNYTKALDLLNVGTLNMPKAGTFLRIKGNTSNMYISSEIGAGNTNYVMTEKPDLSTIFYFDGTNLLNYSTGLYNGMTKDGNTTDGRTNGWGWMIGEEAASEVEFLDGETNGGYGIKSGITDSYGYMFDNGDGKGSNNLGVDRAGSYGANARYRSWALEEITELPITLNNVNGRYYGTLCLPVGVSIEGTEAYIPTLENNKLVCDESITEISANTPVILIGQNPAATAKIKDVTTSAESPLRGTIGKISNPGEDVFVLSAINGSAGFYKYTGANIPGFKAYYVAGDNSASSNGFIISFGDDDDLTGIAEVESAADAAAYYDLQGRRVIAPQRGQLYIVNGKKVLY